MERELRKRMGAVALGAALLAAGCGTGSGGAATTAGNQPEITATAETATTAAEGTTATSASAEPSDATHVVSSPFGEVTLPVSPQAALGMYTTDVDILIALEFPLADDQPIRGDAGYTTFPSFFPQEALEGVTAFANYPDYNYEAILAAGPDFILNGLGYDADVVKRLPEIAPTYSLDAYDGRYWGEHFAETAEALGRTEQYEAWVASYEARITEVKAAIGDKAADITVAPLSWWEGKATSSCYTGVECAVFRDLGLHVFAGAEQDDGAGVELSAEQVGQLADIDYAFAIKSTGEAGQAEYDQMLSEAAKNPLWTDLAFVQNDHIVSYELEMTFGSPSGQMAFLGVVEDALVDD